MPLGRTTAVAAVTALLAAGGLVACGGDEPADEGGAGATTTTVDADGTTTTVAPDPDATTTTASPDGTTTTELDGEGISELEALAAELLVAPAELGVPAEDQGYSPDGTAPACGFTLDAEHPADVLVGTTLRTAGATVVEVLRVYTNTDAAVAAYDAAVEHEAGCGFGDREASGPVDVTERVGADAAVQFAVTDGDGSAVRITTRVADAVVTFSLVGGAELGLDPQEVAAFGVGKILAALEA